MLDENLTQIRQKKRFIADSRKFLPLPQFLSENSPKNCNQSFP